MNNSIDEIRKVMLNSNNIVIAGHTSPDGDAIGACLALAGSLCTLGKKVSVILDRYSEKYDVIPGKELIVYDGYENLKPDLFLSLDCGDRERLGDIAGSIFDKTYNINIDHHISNTYFGNLNYVDNDSSSTSEIIYKLIQGCMPIDKNIASGIYAGLINDTGGFRHSCTSPVTMNVAAELLTYNIPFTKIYNDLYYTHTFVEAKLMGKALENVRRLHDGKVSYTTLTLEDISNCEGTTKQLDGIVEYVKNIGGTYVGVFFYEKGKNEIKASFRSEDEVNVSEIAVSLGGGGHAKAAGCTLEMSLDEAVSTVLNLIKSKLN